MRPANRNDHKPPNAIACFSAKLRILLFHEARCEVLSLLNVRGLKLLTYEASTMALQCYSILVCWSKSPNAVFTRVVDDHCFEPAVFLRKKTKKNPGGGVSLVIFSKVKDKGIRRDLTRFLERRIDHMSRARGLEFGAIYVLQEMLAYYHSHA